MSGPTLEPCICISEQSLYVPVMQGFVAYRDLLFAYTKAHCVASMHNGGFGKIPCAGSIAATYSIMRIGVVDRRDDFCICTLERAGLADHGLAIAGGGMHTHQHSSEMIN